MKGPTISSNDRPRLILSRTIYHESANHEPPRPFSVVGLWVKLGQPYCYERKKILGTAIAGRSGRVA
jgi:hypothetical protein